MSPLDLTAIRGMLCEVDLPIVRALCDEVDRLREFAAGRSNIAAAENLAYRIMVQALEVQVQLREGEAAELRLTLANEIGQGEPPSVGWIYEDDGWTRMDAGTDDSDSVTRDAGAWIVWRNCESRCEPYDTARSAMRAADAARGER